MKIGDETIALLHAGSNDPSRFFLVNGTPFVRNDWNRVEVREGELHDGMDATAWICPDGATIIDW